MNPNDINEESYYESDMRRHGAFFEKHQFEALLWLESWEVTHALTDPRCRVTQWQLLHPHSEYEFDENGNEAISYRSGRMLDGGGNTIAFRHNEAGRPDLKLIYTETIDGVASEYIIVLNSQNINNAAERRLHQQKLNK